MKIIHLHEQVLENSNLKEDESNAIIPYIEDGKDFLYSVRRGKEEHELCLKLHREGNIIKATGSYFIGIDWLKENELALQISPKMNNSFEIDYVRMLNDALCEKENFEHLKDLIKIHFDKPSIPIKQEQDLLSIFLVTEYINSLQNIVHKGLKKSYYEIEENIKNKVKGRILISKNIHTNLSKGRITDNFCKYQVYDIDSPENRILKKALKFCIQQLKIYNHAIDTSFLNKKIKYIKPYFESISDNVNIKEIQTYKGNPIFKDYYQTVNIAKLLLRRYSYDITLTGKENIKTPPFWIDMSKLFELYVFHRLKEIFTAKNEIRYHVNAYYQELDFLLNPFYWKEPYIIDTKYKPRYKNCSISIDDARQIAGYARISSIYKRLGLDEDKALPIKCLIIYPDQEQEEKFTFNNIDEPEFDKITGYIRMYKVGIRLPVINSNN